jgi:hypothetical protein
MAPHVSAGIRGLRCPQAGVEGRIWSGLELLEFHASPQPGRPATYRERLRMLPCTDAPYLQSLSRASPKPYSDRSIQRWDHT